ncbi:hypothetical protein MKK67_14055 [Methylobacterium sp. J-072]|uniref:hypothetical protein n=1 Tax=Methylobacterium sp. J-072 TaxID=2836651 RepID=UPI001FB92DBC|nr:hypothetical protein [Methylobacterium sp. J-072]MCJ2093602.1 hypothetical protein [Methylobacterium sp. J-072]
MDHVPDLGAVADAIIAAHAIIENNGTEMMKTLSRMILLSVGKEIARRIVISKEVEMPKEEAIELLKDPLEKGT